MNKAFRNTQDLASGTLSDFHDYRLWTRHGIAADAPVHVAHRV